MARGSAAPEQQAQTSFTGDTSISILSEDIMIVAEATQQGMKHLDLPGTSKCTIFQMPNHVLGERRELFRPQIVSVGPYSRDNDGGHLNKELLGMEVVKKRFLNDLITKTSPAFLTACLQKLKEQESAIRSCYYKSFNGMRSDVFTKMMLLDGIFIIQYFMKWKKKQDIYSTVGYVPWNFGVIMHDLLLLENQIPFFVLQDLFDLFVTCNSSDDAGSSKNLQLLDEILGGFKGQRELLEIDEKTIIESHVEIKHLLHLYHLWYTCSKRNKSAPESTPGNPYYCYDSCMELIRRRAPELTAPPASLLSATKLQEAGVTFKKKEKTTSFLDVTFNKINGDLEIPPFVRSYKFANLISLEQSANDVPRVITGYAAFMDRIIDTPKDVEILRREGILEDILATNEEITQFFNMMCRYSDLDVVENEDLAQVFRDVHAFCNTRWNRDRAWLMRHQFSNIWVSISFVAAVILLLLTVLQAFFAVYAYFRPPSAS